MYKKYQVFSPEVQALFFAYCEGRSPLWRMFFGFRGIDKDDVCTFLMSKKAHRELLELAKSFDLFKYEA